MHFSHAVNILPILPKHLVMNTITADYSLHEFFFLFVIYLYFSLFLLQVCVLDLRK